MSGLSGKELEDALESSSVELSIIKDSDCGYLHIDVEHRTYLPNEETDIQYGYAKLYGFNGENNAELIDMADSISSDVLYAATCGNAYSHDQTRLFIVLDVQTLEKGYDTFPFITKAVFNIVETLFDLCGPFYFTFMPEALVGDGKTQYQRIVDDFVHEGYHIDVGIDREQICLSKAILEDLTLDDL